MLPSAGSSVNTITDAADAISETFALVALDLYLKHPSSHRLLISVSGVPGSGKTFFTNAIIKRLNTISQLRYGVAIACSVPMDGFHHSRKTLDGFPNPEEAHRRRGAPFTFDAIGLHQLLDQLKDPGISNESKIIQAPSFDHAIKDPVMNDISILASQRIIIFEGNYLCFEPPDETESNGTQPSPLWKKISNLFDEKWIVDTPLEVTTSRLASRHLEAGIVTTLVEGYARANGSDRQNAEDIIRWRGKFDRKI